MKTPLLLILMLFTLGMSAQSGLRQKQFNLGRYNLAIQGYDPVAYFTQSKGVKGSSSYSYTHEGVLYYFSSESNKALFQKNPTKYEPQYGGWCAYAMGKDGSKVSIDPGTFKILDGKLYLFYYAWGTNTLPYWNKDEKSLKPKADSNWTKLFR